MRFVVALTLLIASAVGPFACSNDLDLAFTRTVAPGVDAAVDASRRGVLPESSPCAFACEAGSDGDVDAGPDEGPGGDGDLLEVGIVADADAFGDVEVD